MADILHLHGFKCAGTTFAWILEKNYPGAVGYVESENRGTRLPWQRIPAEVDISGWRAISSHLVTLPGEGEGPARLNVAFVRDPAARLRSAYDFQRKTGSLPVEGETFGAFLTRIRTSTLSNYQTRQLSYQDDGGWDARAGWQLRPELIRLGRSDTFIGLVERFDESLVVLERRLAAIGIPFDAAYPAAQNRGDDRADQPRRRVPVDMTEVDDVLHRRVSQHLAVELASFDAETALADFRRRCEALKGSALAGQVRVPGPQEWTYLPPPAVEGES